MFTSLSDCFTQLANAVRGKAGGGNYTPEQAVEAINNLYVPDRYKYVGIVKPYYRYGAQTQATPTLLLSDFNAYLGDHYDPSKTTGGNFDDYLAQYPNGYSVEEWDAEDYMAQRDCMLRPSGSGLSTLIITSAMDISTGRTDAMAEARSEQMVLGIPKSPLTFFFPTQRCNSIVTRTDYDNYDIFLAGAGWDFNGTSIPNYDAYIFLGKLAWADMQYISEHISGKFMETSFGDYIQLYNHLIDAITMDIVTGKTGETIESSLFPFEGDFDFISFGSWDGSALSNAVPFVRLRRKVCDVLRTVTAPYVNFSFSMTQREIEKLRGYGFSEESISNGHAYLSLTNPTNTEQTFVCVLNDDSATVNYPGNLTSRIPAQEGCRTAYVYCPLSNTYVNPNKLIPVVYDSTAGSYEDMDRPEYTYVVVRGEDLRLSYADLANANVFFQPTRVEGSTGSISLESLSLSRAEHATVYPHGYEVIGRILEGPLPDAPKDIFIEQGVLQINEFAGTHYSKYSRTSTVKVYFEKTTPPNILNEFGDGDGAIDTTEALVQIIVPVGSLSAYQTALPLHAAAGLITEGTMPNYTTFTKQDIIAIGEALIA